MFAGNFAPYGWEFCEGQIMPISENEALFSLIGTTYGGDGQTTFALPDLRGRVPVHSGGGFVIAETGGVETVTLTVQQIPAHSHPLLGSQDAGTQPSPQGFVPAANNVVKSFTTLPSTAALATQAMTATGGSLPHDNMQPYLCLSFIISLFGVFPSQS